MKRTEFLFKFSNFGNYGNGGSVFISTETDPGFIIREGFGGLTLEEADEK